MSSDFSMIILSDIHGHFEYLSSLLDVIESVDLVVVLGDIDIYNNFTENSRNFFDALLSKTKLKLLSGNCDPDSYREFLSENPLLSIEHRSETYSNYTISGFGGTIPQYELTQRTRSYLNGKKVTPQLQANIEKEFGDALYLRIKDGHYESLTETPDIQIRWRDEETIYFFDENEIYDFFTKIKSQNSSQIWFTHSPPYNFPESKDVGMSNGSKGLYKAIKKIQPLFVISGHLHKEGSWKIGDTLCLSVPPLEEGEYAKIEVENNAINYQFHKIKEKK